MARAGRSQHHYIWLAALFAGFLVLVTPVLSLSSDLPVVNAKDLESAFSLEGQWRFTPGDKMAWAKPGFDDSQWSFAALPGLWPKGGFPESRQMAWYRLSLNLTPNALNKSRLPDGIGLRMGKVMSAYEVYVNGKLLGSAGKLPPLARPHYDQPKVFLLPRELIGPDGRLDIALRVWGGTSGTVKYWGGGPYGGDFTLGDYKSLILNGVADHLPSLVLSVLFLAFGLNHLYLYRRNPQLKLYLWFGLTTINIAVYSLMQSQWKYLLPLSFDSLKVLEICTIFVLPAVSLKMIWALLALPPQRWMTLYQFSFLSFIVVGLINPWTDNLPRALFLFELWALPVLFIIPVMLWRAMHAGNAEVRTMFLGLILFGITCVNDILMDVIHLDSNRMIHWGFIAAVLSMAVSVGNRFTAMLNQLEREVQEHTEELRNANIQLSLVARMDPLTGLLNRRGFIDDTDKEIQRVNRGSPSFALILADIDHFKIINDRHGHTCGDEVLRRVAALLLQRMREVDIVGRWGGEEFILVLPETDRDGAAVVAEYLRIAMETALFQYQDEPLKFTMTFGIATYIKGENLDSTVLRADTALYLGKDSGRNRVMVEPYHNLSAIP